jgi:phage tail sheath protein FI
MLFGDKTLSPKPSAFDRINVRRLFIFMEKVIGEAARGVLFQFNTDFTRSQFQSSTEGFLQGIQAGQGLTDFQVVCDDTNNTADVIDSNKFVADIFVKPTKSINFIRLSFVAVRSGVSFDEAIGNV